MKNMRRFRILGRTLNLLFSFWVLSPLLCSAEDAAESTVEYQAGFYYTVKQGDTLWDLSRHFSDTPWQWPDLWHENKQLSNPHWIYPGERIRLFRKTEQGRGEVSTAALQVPAVVPQADSTAPVKEEKPQVEFFLPNMDQVGFIRQPAVTPLGTIFKSINEKRLISKDDSVYIRYANSSSAEALVPGARLTVYRTLRPGDDAGSERRYGTQHLLTGVAEVTKVEANYAVAKVMKTYRAILLEDMVMPYESQKASIPVLESTPGVDGRIIASEGHNQLLGTYYIAFIDKGAEDKIQAGQIYNIYRADQAPTGFFGRMMDLEKINIGSVLVLHTEQNNSTVIVTANAQKITPGDRFKTP